MRAINNMIHISFKRAVLIRFVGGVLLLLAVKLIFDVIGGWLSLIHIHEKPFSAFDVLFLFIVFLLIRSGVFLWRKSKGDDEVVDLKSFFLFCSVSLLSLSSAILLWQMLSRKVEGLGYLAGMHEWWFLSSLFLGWVFLFIFLVYIFPRMMFGKYIWHDYSGPIWLRSFALGWILLLNWVIIKKGWIADNPALPWPGDLIFVVISWAGFWLLYSYFPKKICQNHGDTH